jgi:TonB family protein
MVTGTTGLSLTIPYQNNHFIRRVFMRLPRTGVFLLVPALLAASSFAATPKAESPVTEVSAKRITTGVIAPVLVQNRISIPPTSMNPDWLSQVTVVLSLYIDDQGHAQSVRVVKSSGAELDARVVDGILHSQFQPATLNHQPIGFELDLAVNVQR